MLLTQRSAAADLQAFLGLSVTLLANADATALLTKAFNELYVLFDKGALFFDDSVAKYQAIQKEAEVALGAYYYYREWAPKKLLVDFETYGQGLGQGIDMGPFKIDEKGFSKKGLGDWYKESALQAKETSQIKIALLLKGQTTVIVESNYR